jgi:hypothetical protein
MDYKVINEALSNIDNLRTGKKFKKVVDSTIDNLKGEERQGAYNEITEVYSLGVSDIHIKLSLKTDSYGDNEFIHGVQIVKPVIKQVTDFEAI